MFDQNQAVVKTIHVSTHTENCFKKWPGNTFFPSNIQHHCRVCGSFKKILKLTRLPYQTSSSPIRLCWIGCSGGKKVQILPCIANWQIFSFNFFDIRTLTEQGILPPLIWLITFNSASDCTLVSKDLKWATGFIALLINFSHHYKVCVSINALSKSQLSAILATKMIHLN